jgi:hypothetical protein
MGLFFDGAAFEPELAGANQNKKAPPGDRRS